MGVRKAKPAPLGRARAHTINEAEPEPSMTTALITYVNYLLAVLLAYTLELLGWLAGERTAKTEGYAPLLKGFEDLWQRRFYRRIEDCFNRPICSNPGAYIDVMERERKGIPLVPTGKTTRCLNLGSYNYLGFADQNEMCRDDVKAALRKHGIVASAPLQHIGHTTLQQALEDETAQFLGKEAAMIIGMGFATNSTILPYILSKGDLLVSDELNHASIVTGAKSSGARVKVFKHNSISALERVLQTAIVQGQPRTGLPWKKILVIVEGIYSMEGEIVKLPGVVAMCKKYKAYLWLDEAHSIGCMGKTGRGVCEHLGVSPDDIDIMMGTFTKSFGAVGGYVAGSKKMIDWLRRACPANLHSTTMSPSCNQQILSALLLMQGKDGTNTGNEKLSQLRANSNLFRTRLKAMGCHVLGDHDSPVVPVMIYNPPKLAGISRECLKRGIAVVVVSFPATPLLLGRVRFCLSAGHSTEDLNTALDILEEVFEDCMILYGKPPVYEQWVAEMWAKGQDKARRVLGWGEAKVKAA